MQHFRHIMLYYFKKGKNATEMQKKICAVYGESAVADWMRMEKVLWLTECVKSGSLSFVLEISRWTMLHAPVDQLKLTAINWDIENQHYTTWEIANILKMSKSIKLSVKMKNVSFIWQKKTTWTFWPTQYTTYSKKTSLTIRRICKGCIIYCCVTNWP